MAEMLTKSFLMGLDRSTRKMEFAEPTAEEIETLPYAEAVEYLRKRDVLNKVDYDRLSAQLKFRAFTASRISDGALLKRINGELIKNIEAGNGLKDFLGMTKTDVLSKVGFGNAGGWYWETVYRTNVQTAYNAGRMMGYERDKPLALELVVIDDARTTDYCRQYAGKGFILPYDDPFWKSHIPPFHFNCRTTIRAIYDEREIPQQWSSKGAIEEPAKGFGNNPVVDDSWWKELSSQVRQAKMYNVQSEIETAYIKLIEQGFTTGRSVGAMAKRFHVDMPQTVKIEDDESSIIIKEGTDVTGLKVIAQGSSGGKEVKRGIDDIKRLVKQYTLQNGSLTSEKDWYKVRGTAILFDLETKVERKAEIHWYQCKDIGKVEFKFKRFVK